MTRRSTKRKTMALIVAFVMIFQSTIGPASSGFIGVLAYGSESVFIEFDTEPEYDYGGRENEPPIDTPADDGHDDEGNLPEDEPADDGYGYLPDSPADDDDSYNDDDYNNNDDDYNNNDDDYNNDDDGEYDYEDDDYDYEDDYYYEDEEDDDDAEYGYIEMPGMGHPGFPEVGVEGEANVVIRLTTMGDNHITGEEITVFISTEFSQPTVGIYPPGDFSDFLVARIPIPCPYVILTDFPAHPIYSGLHRSLIIFTNNRSIEFRLVGEDGTPYRFLEFNVYEGSQNISFNFLFPNGLLHRRELTLTPYINFGLNHHDIINIISTTFGVESSFGWNNVTLLTGLNQNTANIIPPSAASNSLIGTLDRVITYQIRATSQNNQTTGTIFTYRHVTESTITFPQGVFTTGGSFDPIGNRWVNDAEGTIIQVLGEGTAQITPLPSYTGYITGFTVNLTHYNPSATQEINDLNLQITINGNLLYVDIPLFNQDLSNNQINHRVNFTAYPVAGPASLIHESNAQTSATVTGLGALITGRLQYVTPSPTTPVVSGTVIYYQIPLVNTGWGDATVTVTFMVPSGATLRPYFDDRFSIVNSASPITTLTGDFLLKAQEELTLEFSVIVNSGLREGTNLTASATVGGTPSNITHTTPLSVIRHWLESDRAEYSIVRAGDDITYTIVVWNEERATANINVTAPIPIGTILANLPEGATQTPQGLTWTGVEIGPYGCEYETHILRFVYTVTVRDNIANGAHVSNTVSVNGALSNMIVFYTPEANVTIYMDGESDNNLEGNRVRPENIITYGITLDNSGEGHGLVNVVGTVPPGTVLVGTDLAQAVRFIIHPSDENNPTVVPAIIPTRTGNTLRWNNIFIPGGYTIRLEFDTRVTAARNNEMITNRATMNAQGTEHITYPIITHRVVVSDISFSLNANPPRGAVVFGGDEVEYIITVYNRGSYPGTADIFATIPEGTTLIHESVTVTIDGEQINLAELENVQLEPDERNRIRITAPVPPTSDDTPETPGTVRLTYRVALGAMTGIHRIEQVSHVNQINSRMVYHTLPLPIVGQGKRAYIYLEQNGELVRRQNNVFEIEEGGTIMAFDPEFNSIFPLNLREITYVMEGDFIIYEITAFNLGLGAANIDIRDTVPFGTTLYPYYDHGATVTGRTLNWTFALPPATTETDEGGGTRIVPASETVRFKVRVNTNLRNGFNIANQANVNGEATNRIDFFLPVADVRIEQSAETAAELDYIYIPGRPIPVQPVGLGEYITYTLTLTNRGLADGVVQVRNQLPPGVIFRGIEENETVPVPTVSGAVSTILTWTDITVPGLAGMVPESPAVELVFHVEVYAEAAFQELVNTMKGRQPTDSGFGPTTGTAIHDPRASDNFPRHPDGVRINDTEEIFNFAILSDLVDGRNDQFSNTIRHMVVRPIFSFTLSADPEEMRNIGQVASLGQGVEEGDILYYFIDIANSGHATGYAIAFGHIPTLTEHIPGRAYIVELDENGDETAPRTPVSMENYILENGEIAVLLEIPYRSVLRFAFAVEVGKLYDGFRIEKTANVNNFRTRTIYHFSPIPRVTIAMSASTPYAHLRTLYGNVPAAQRRYPNLYPNGLLVPFPWDGEIGLPSDLSNGVNHLRTGTGAFDETGPTVVHPGQRFTYFITVWSESSRSVVDVVNVLPLFVRPVADSARIVDTGSGIVPVGSITTAFNNVQHQGVTVPRYTVRWNRLHMPRTTRNINTPVVLAVDVVVQVPQTNLTLLNNYARAISRFREPNGVYRSVDAFTNRAEHVIARSSATFSKYGRAANGNDPYVQLGERIDYLLTLGNPSRTAPDPFVVTDTLHRNLVDNHNGINIRDTITAVITDNAGNILYEVGPGNQTAAPRVFTTSGGDTIPLPALSWTYNPATRTITWQGGLKPGEYAELRFSAFVQPIQRNLTGNMIVNYGVLNGVIRSNSVVHEFVPRRVAAGKFNNNPPSLLSGSIIEYTLLVANAQPITTRYVLVEDRISEHTVFVPDSDRITGGLYSFRYGGTDSVTGYPIRPGQPGYNPEVYFQYAGFLTWVVDLGPYAEGYYDHTVTIVYEAEVRGRILEDTRITNTVIVVRDPARPEIGGPWATDRGQGGEWTPPPGGWPGGGGGGRRRPWLTTGGGGVGVRGPVLGPWGPGGGRPEITENNRGGGGYGSIDDPTRPGGPSDPNWREDPDGPGGPGIPITPSLVATGKHSSVPWDGINEHTRTLNWHYPSNASLVSVGEVIEYFITLYIPEGSFPDGNPSSRYVNVVDPLPFITVRRYEDRFMPEEVRAVVGRTVLVDPPTISWSDGQQHYVRDIGFDGNNVFWNFVEVPYGVTVTLRFSVMAEPNLSALTLNRHTQLLIENRAYVNNRRTNSVFHEIARPAIVGEKFIGITNAAGEREWVQTVEWFTGEENPTADQQVFVTPGQVFPFKISLGNAGYGAGEVMLRDQINGLLRVVEPMVNVAGIVTSIRPLTPGMSTQSPEGHVGTLVTTGGVNWLHWNNIRVAPRTAYIHGRLIDQNGADPRNWVYIRNNPDTSDTTVDGLNFTITDPVNIIFYVQVIGDPDQGQQINNHALFNHPYLEINEMAGMGRTNQVDAFVQRTLFVARQESNPLPIPHGAQVNNSLVQGRVLHGQEITYTIEVANAGGAGGFVEVAIPIPDGMVFAGMLYGYPEPVLQRRTVARRNANNVLVNIPMDVMVWSNVPLPASERGMGMIPRATGEVVIGYVTGQDGTQTKYIGIGSVANTHATARLMPWDEATRVSFRFNMRVAEEDLVTDIVTGEESIITMINGSRIDSAPFITEQPVFDFEIPRVVLQNINVYPAVLSHFVPTAEIVGVKTAEFTDGNRHVYKGRRLINNDGDITIEDFIYIDRVPATAQELNRVFVGANTEITYTLTAYNIGLARGTTILWSQIPLHTNFVESSDGSEPNAVNLIQWNMAVPALDSRSVSFTVRIIDDVANGATIENTSMIAGRYTNRTVFRTLPPAISAVKELAAIYRNDVSVPLVLSPRGNFEVERGDVVVYRIIVQNTGQGRGVVRITDQISNLLHGVRDIYPANGNMVGNRLVWEGIIIDPPGGAFPDTVTLEFTATVGFPPTSPLPPPAQGTVIPNSAVFDNAVQDVDDADIDGEVTLGLGETNVVNLEVQAPILRAYHSAVTTGTAELPNEILPRERITYTIRVTNTGGANGPVRISAPIPRYTTLIDDLPLQNNTIVWYVVAERGSYVEVSFTVEVNHDVPNGSRISHSPTVSGMNITPATITHQVPIANVAATISSDVDYVTAGGHIVYTVRLTNNARVDGVMLVSVQIPPGTTLYPSSISDGGAFYSEFPFIGTNGATQMLRDVVVWQNVVVAAGTDAYAPVSLNFTAVAANLPNGEVIRARARYGSRMTNEATVIVQASEFRGALRVYRGEANLAVNARVRYREVITYAITATNVGALAGTVTITNQVPHGTSLVPGSVTGNMGWDDGVMVWEIPNVPAGGYVTVSFDVVVGHHPNLTRIVNNNVLVDGTILPQHTLIVAAPVISANITSNPVGGKINPGEGNTYITFTINLTNTGDADGFANAVIEIPNGLSFVEFIGEHHGATNPTASIITIPNVNVPATPTTNGTVSISYRVRVTGLWHNSTVRISDGYAMVTSARATDVYAPRDFDTNSIVHSFAPQRIYPGLRLQVLGNTRMVNDVLRFTASNNGIISGAERTDGYRLGVVVDNIGGSINTTHISMNPYTIAVTLPALHVLDQRVGTGIDLRPRFVPLNAAGNPIGTPIIIPEAAITTQPGQNNSDVVHINLFHEAIPLAQRASFTLAQGQQARVEFHTRAQFNGNADPLFFEARMVPTQDFIPSQVRRGNIRDIYGVTTLVAFASVFPVGVHTTEAYIRVTDTTINATAQGNGNPNWIRSEAGNRLVYTLVLTNTSTVTYNHISLIGRMPHINDSVVINANIPRQSGFNVDFVNILGATITPAGGAAQSVGYEIRFVNQMGDFTVPQWNNINNWGTTPPVPGSKGQSYRINFGSEVTLPPGATLRVQIEAVAPQGNMANHTAWKSFAFMYNPVGFPLGMLNLRAEVAVVGVQQEMIIPDNLVWHRVDDEDSRIIYAGNWYARRRYARDYYRPYLHGHFYQNTQMHTIGVHEGDNSTDNYVEFTFFGAGIRWIGARSTDLGIARVFINDETTPTYVDLFGYDWVDGERHFRPQVTLFERLDLQYYYNTIRIYQTGQRNAALIPSFAGFHRLTVDAFEVLASPVGETRIINNTELRVSYFGPDRTPYLSDGTANANWRYDPPAALMGLGFHMHDQHVGLVEGAFVEFQFTGTQIDVMGAFSSNLGYALFRLNGEDYIRCLWYGPGFISFQPIFSSPVLENGTHTLRVYVLGTSHPSSDGHYITIDAFRYVTS